ncbi:homocysteine S-methyltransferase family protein [Halomonas sp. M20]|uniref:homocysteine S-methyltransferase family protein n=1 Tax=Halomonas sp. M20 TaxID=2763264 RepID=UPI001D0BE11C|nr:homocysteine S-methyltransferase family protein [Halomonas sp. M20]
MKTLPQSSGELFLTDGGLETDLIFNHGIEIREFAAHTLLSSAAGRHALAEYFRGFLSLARECGTGFILDAPTWKAHSHWAQDLGATEAELRTANLEAVNFIATLRDEFAGNQGPTVLNAVIGPKGDAYAPETLLSASEAEEYHAQQLHWLTDSEVEMVSALTFTQAEEATGIVRAADKAGLPIVVSFTVETDGRLPTGQPLGEAIQEVDAATRQAAAYFMVNCAHPEHFIDALTDDEWTRRIKGLRCNASRCSHAELDAAEELDAGNPLELAAQYGSLVARMPWVNVLGGCCGTDLRHVHAIAAAFTSGDAMAS